MSLIKIAQRLSIIVKEGEPKREPKHDKKNVERCILAKWNESLIQKEHDVLSVFGSSWFIRLYDIEEVDDIENELRNE